MLPEINAAPQVPLAIRWATAEKNLLGNILFTPQNPKPREAHVLRLLDAADALNGYRWANPRNQAIFAAAVRIAQTGVYPGQAAIQAELNRVGNAEAADFAAELAREFFSDAELQYWSAQCLELGRACDLYTAADRMKAALDAGQSTADVSPLLADLQAEGNAVSSGKLPELKIVPIGDIRENPEPEQQWIIDGLVPAGTVTNLAGHGGTGKSLLLLEAAAHVATGMPFLGRNVARGAVVYFSAEDGSPMIRRRMGPIYDAFGLDPAEVAAGLTIIDAQDNPTLYAVNENKYGSLGTTTPTYAALKALLSDIKPKLLIVDNGSDSFEGNENERRIVRGFVRSLVAAVTGFGGSVILLLHTNKISARGKDKSTENYSGSTAWHNSARSRLALLRDEEAGEGRSVLVHEKCNLGPLSEPIPLQYSGGVILQAYDDSTSTVGSETTLLGMVAEFNSRNEHLYVNTRAPANAFKVLSGEPNFPKRMSRGAFDAAMRSLQRRKHIQVSQEKNPQRRIVEIWRATPEGMAAIQPGVNHVP